VEHREEDVVVIRRIQRSDRDGSVTQFDVRHEVVALVVARLVGGQER
jgi:hypothetical protein